jgi:hypothetical protein
MNPDPRWKPWHKNAIWFGVGMAFGLLIAVLMAAQTFAKIPIRPCP